MRLIRCRLDSSLFFKLVMYFRHGHATWLAFIVNMISFVVIVYALLIREVPILHQFIPDIYTFAILFALIYFPTCVVVGYLDTRRGVYRETLRLWARMNPIIRDIALVLLLQSLKAGDVECVRILYKWVSDIAPRDVRVRVEKLLSEKCERCGTA